MKILVTNDDGIDARGIQILAGALAAAHDVTVAAPDTERSGSSHSLSFMQPIMYEEAEWRGDAGIPAYKIFGTPSDCVKFALSHIMPQRPRLVISGINRGANLGTDIMYSGTVAAALEAVYLGVPSVAVSASARGEVTDEHYRACADYIAGELPQLTSLNVPHHTLLNVNVPYPPGGKIKGVKFTPMGIQEYDDVYVRDERELRRFWLRGNPIAHNRNDSDCDIEWNKRGYITVTPIFYDMTNYEFLKTLK